MSEQNDNRAAGQCWNCGTSLDGVLLPLSRHEYCRACSEALHACRQCALYDPRATGQCRESRAEPPTDRTAANFCDWFEFSGAAGAAAGSGRSAADEARAKLEALFGGSEAKD